MTEVEFLILTNQGLILNALVTLTEKPMSGVLLEQAENTIKYLEENIVAMRNEKS